MSFPSTTGTRQDSLAIAWTKARDVAARIKSGATLLRNQSASGNVGSGAILGFANSLADAKETLTRAAATSGIGAYAQEQINDNTINIANEFNAMMAAIDSVVSWVTTNFPKDVNGFLLAVTFAGDGTGRVVDRQFTTAQLATFRTVLDSLIATID